MNVTPAIVICSPLYRVIADKSYVFVDAVEPLPAAYVVPVVPGV